MLLNCAKKDKQHLQLSARLFKNNLISACASRSLASHKFANAVKRMSEIADVEEA